MTKFINVHQCDGIREWEEEWKVEILSDSVAVSTIPTSISERDDETRVMLWDMEEEGLISIEILK